MKSTRRTRLSTEQRRAQLLDVTQELILEQGLNAFTMETLARRANVSNPLVYKYFSTRLELLQSLLKREFDLFYGSLLNRLNDAEEIVDIVRIFVGINFDNNASGKILPALLHLSDVREIIGDAGKKRRDNVRNILVLSIAKNYGVTVNEAASLAKMASGASIAAAEHCRDQAGNVEESIDKTVQFILGAMAPFKK
jgi:AcrR family transcriptional regulator